MAEQAFGVVYRGRRGFGQATCNAEVFRMRMIGRQF
jgi:hypothetical protein